MDKKVHLDINPIATPTQLGIYPVLHQHHKVFKDELDCLV
jgi:hypothetical protein